MISDWAFSPSLRRTEVISPSSSRSCSADLVVGRQFGEELGDGRAHLGGVDPLQAGHGVGEVAQAGLVELFEHRARGIRAQHADDNGRLLLAGETPRLVAAHWP